MKSWVRVVLEREHLEPSPAWELVHLYGPHLLLTAARHWDRRSGHLNVEMACPRHLIHRTLKQARLALAPKPRAAQHALGRPADCTMWVVVLFLFFEPRRWRPSAAAAVPNRKPQASPAGGRAAPPPSAALGIPAANQIRDRSVSQFWVLFLAPVCGPGTPGHGRQGRLDWIGDRDGWNRTRDWGIKGDRSWRPVSA